MRHTIKRSDDRPINGNDRELAFVIGGVPNGHQEEFITTGDGRCHRRLPVGELNTRTCITCHTPMVVIIAGSTNSDQTV
ncbi:MAG: hypothetical protein OEW48_17080, partial [Phycisphaerae bacterium]|nr:hypothetical protein [Phycisphaerae bacterium]